MMLATEPATLIPAIAAVDKPPLLPPLLFCGPEVEVGVGDDLGDVWTGVGLETEGVLVVDEIDVERVVLEVVVLDEVVIGELRSDTPDPAA
jgi:hypothetical protein